MEKRFITLLLIIFVMVACRENIISKPDNLIPEDEMEAILYDLTLLNAGNNTNSGKMKDNNVNVNDFIYKKYHIDSLQLAESTVYYASIPKTYTKMIEGIDKKLKAIKDSISKQNNTGKELETLDRKLQKDSVLETKPQLIK